MQYYEDDTRNRSGKRGGIVAVGVYLAAWLAVMLLVSFTMERKETGGGMIIDFGDTDSALAASSDSQPASASASSSDPSIADPDPQDMLTQDHEDAPTVTPSNRLNPDSDNTSQSQQLTPAEPQPRQVDPRTLFPGNGSSNTQHSQQTGTQAGAQGSPDGAQGGGEQATGSNNAAGPGFSLDGRSVVGSLPYPTYNANKAGRVVVQITVNPEGYVIQAQFRAAGSTTNDSQLVDAALRAARQSRFNKIESDTPQTGTITYDFKLQ